MKKGRKILPSLMNRENQSEKSWDLQKWTIWFPGAKIFIHLLCNTTQSAAQVALKFAACKCVGKIACCCSQTYFPMYTVYIHSLLQYIHSCMFVWKFDLGFRHYNSKVKNYVLGAINCKIVSNCSYPSTYLFYAF